MVAEINETNFQENINQGKVIVDFYADWCGPCKIIEPVVEKMTQEFKDINFFRLNVDANQQAAMSHGVRSIPTIIFFKNGKEVDRVIGLMQEQDFKAKIKEAFK